MVCAKLSTKAIDGVVEAILPLIGRALECSKLVAEFLNGFLEIRYFFSLMDTTNRSGKREGWGQQTHLSSFGLHVAT